MKFCTKLLAFAGVIAASIGSAHADTLRGYVEVGAGPIIMNQVESKTVAEPGPTARSTFVGHGEGTYKNSGMITGEIGVGGIANSMVRVGLSYDYVQTQLDHLNIIGTVTTTPAVGPVTTQEIRESYSREDLQRLGAPFGLAPLDNDIQLIQAQAYLNLPPIGNRLRAFIGAGAGVATFTNADAEPVISATLGARYAISNNMYVSVKARAHRIDGPTSDLGDKFRTLKPTSVMITLGGYF